MTRNIALDIFRLIAAFFVVCIHAPFLIWGSNPIYKCAVPFFCLITGYYLNTQTLDYKTIQCRIRKYLKVLITAVIVYSCYYILTGNSIILPNFVCFILFNSFGFIKASHLWYLLALIITFIIIFVLNRYGKLWVVYLFIPLILVPPLGKYNIEPFSTLISQYDANWILTTMPYMACGLGIREYGGGIKHGKIFLFISFVFLIVSLCESKIYGRQLLETSAFYGGTPLYSIGIFIYLLSVKIPISTNWIKIADFCKSASLYIYVWHYLLINMLRDAALYDTLQPFVALYVFIFLCVTLYLKNKIRWKIETKQ